MPILPNKSLVARNVGLSRATRVVTYLTPDEVRQIESAALENPRKGQRDMLHLMVAEPKVEYNSIAARSRGINEAPDDTIEEIQRKSDQFDRLVMSSEYQHAQQVADAWCAAFAWN